MPTIIVTSSGLEKGIHALAYMNEGYSFVIPENVREKAEQSAFSGPKLSALFDTLVSQPNVKQESIPGTAAALDAETDRELERAYRQKVTHLHRERRSTEDEHRTLETVKRDVVTYRAASKAIEGEKLALISRNAEYYFSTLKIPYVTYQNVAQTWIPNNLLEQITKFHTSDHYAHLRYAFLATMVLFFTVWVVLPLAMGFVLSLFKLLAAYPTIWMPALVAWAFGLLLYSFRSRGRFWYGMFELAFGISVSYMAFPTNASWDLSLSQWLAFFGTIYVIVRGLDNIGKGIKHEGIQKYWVWVFGSDYR